MRDGYAVIITKLGEPILTVERQMLTGAHLTEEDDQAIREAAQALLAIVGHPEAKA